MSKQYLMMVDEVSMAVLGRLCPSIQFLVVEGMNIKDNQDYIMLTSPVAKPQEVSPAVEDSADENL